MEYVYSALLLHKLGKPIDADNVTKVLQSCGAEVDESKVKSLVASLSGVNIDEELANAVVASAAPAAPAGAEEKKEKAPKEEKKEASAEGLSALFG